MKARPLVSVIIPTYNRLAFLQEAIQSVMRQSYSNYEILVADDGSTDGTADYLSEMSGSIRFLRLEHSGFPSISRNQAIAEARGDWVAFLDDDDVWLPDKLTRHILIAEHNPATGFVYGNLRLFSEEGVSGPVLTKQLNGHILDALIEDCFIHPSTLMVKKSLLSRLNGFEEAFNIVEDYDLCLRLASISLASFAEEPLVQVRRHSGGISISRKLDIQNNSIRMFQRFVHSHRLSVKQIFRIRAAMAHRYTHAGLLYKNSGDNSVARQQFIASILVFPLQRRAWMELVRG